MTEQERDEEIFGAVKDWMERRVRHGQVAQRYQHKPHDEAETYPLCVCGFRRMMTVYQLAAISDIMGACVRATTIQYRMRNGWDAREAIMGGDGRAKASKGAVRTVELGGRRMTVREAADALGVDQRTVRSWADASEKIDEAALKHRPQLGRKRKKV